MRKTIATLALMMAALPALADTPREVRGTLGNPQVLGSATFRWLGIPLYDATLYSRADRFDWSEPMALELVYARDISAGQLVDATMSELDRIEGRQPDHDRIAQSLQTCFRGVSQGDRYVAAATRRDSLGFWLNGRKTCDLTGARIAPRILAIWLSPDSRAAHLSARLRGG